MKTFIVILLLNSIVLCLQAQDDKVIHWINKNAIEIENANPDSQLVAFHKQLPKKFSEAQIFGFGEATHHSKEFSLFHLLDMNDRRLPAHGQGIAGVDHGGAAEGRKPEASVGGLEAR